jgi:hypothetical protein
VGDWYTIGLSLGVGLGLGILFVAALGVRRVTITMGAAGAAAAGGLVGFIIGDTAEVIAGAAAGLIGAACGAAIVLGAVRRGGTRLGLAMLMGIGGVTVALLALVPLVGYVETVVLPFLTLRMRRRQASRFAGLRTLAK